MVALPTHKQLALPLLLALGEGALSPSQAADRVCEMLQLPSEVREATQPMPGYSRRGVNLLERRLRWVKQSHVRAGFVHSEERARWQLTASGQKFSQDASPGILVTVFETELGAAVWAEFETAMGVIADGSVQALVTSPPYPVVGGKKYGRFTPDQCLAMLDKLFRSLPRVLKPDASVILNLTDVWERGQPTRSLYQEELLIKLVKEQGWKLCDRFSRHNPAAPACTDWVTKRRERVRSTMETFFWLAPTAHPYADNRQVLAPYGATMRRILANGGVARSARPSGHGSGHKGKSYSRNNGGSIPGNFFRATNASSNDAYQRFCRSMGLPIHPARFPEDGRILEFFVNLTTRPGDLLVDCFSGSQKLPSVCEELGRRWFSVEKHLPYIRGGEARLRHADGFHSYAIPGENRLVLPLPS